MENGFFYPKLLAMHMSRLEKTIRSKRLGELLLGAPGDPLRSEREQAILRLTISIGFWLFVVSKSVLNDTIAEFWASGSWEYMTFFVIGALAIYLSTHLYPYLFVPRRIFGVAFDIFSFSVALELTGELGAPWFPVYLWIIFGNTLRYGKRYLYLSSLFSVVGFSLVLLTNDYWQQHFSMGVGLLISLMVLPAYAATLAQRLRNAQLAAEAANKAKSQFLANMSHEIRTPLNGIIGATELLKERDLPKEEKYFVDVINRSGSVLLDLINDILDLSKIEANRLVSENEPLDLHRFLNSVVGMMEIQAQKKGLRLLRSIDPRIPWELKGDEHHLKQVLINLLGNGIKFTETGEVELRCVLVKRSGSRVDLEFSVRDTGIGIPEEVQEQILEPFTQAESSISRKYGGTGLGTTIARELVALMGGELTLESTPGEGTVFRFVLSMQVMENEGGLDLLPMAGRSVLSLVSDRPLSASLSARMQEWSIDVLPAGDVQTAERLLRQAYYDYSPVVAVVLEQSLASQIDISLERWGQEGLLGSDVSIVVVAGEEVGVPALPAADQRVSNGWMWVRSEEELFNALHAVRSPVDLEEGIFALGKDAVTPLNILIADDNATNRLILASMLRNAGHRVTETEDGESFLAAIEADDYDLAMLDMHMPDMNGLEVYQLYRFAHAGEETIPFIVVTADVTETARAACEKAGIERVLSKPLSAKQLFETIENLGIGESNIALDGEAALSAVPMEDVPLVDERKVEELLSLDAGTALVERIMECFDEDAEKILEQMQMVVGLRDYYSMQELAHALRGSAANVGMTRVQLVSEQWEQMSETEFNSVGTEKVDELADLVRESSYLLSVQFGLEKPRPKLRVV